VVVSLTLNKYKIEIADDSVPAGDTFTFSLINSWDLSGYLMGDLIITRQLESESVFNFAVSSVSLTISGNDVLTTEITRDNLEEYTYGVEVFGNGVRKFVGQVDPSNITYDQDNEVWEMRGKDWYKYFYDALSLITWNYGSQDLSGYLRQTFGLSDEKFLQVGTIDTPYVDPYGDNWTRFTPNIEILQDYHLLSRTDYLFEVIKHFGGFIYIDADYKLNFINRSRRTPPVYAHNIDPLDQTTVKTYLRDSYYDGVLVSQKTIISPTQSEISWKLLRYIGGEMVVTTILDPNQISAFRGLRVLDIRQKLGASWTGSTYTWNYQMGFAVFPQRPYSETLKDYRDLFQRPVMLESEIEYNEDAELLSHFFYNDGNGAIEYIIEYIEEDLVEEKMLIRAKEDLEPLGLP